MPALTLAHSPDPDDVFMWWPLGAPGAPPAFDTAPFTFEPIAHDIQVLNRRAIERGDLDITAISIHAYPHVRERYALTDCAGSFGEGYGPRVVVREGEAVPADEAGVIAWLLEPRRAIAVPGVHTTAFLTLSLMLGARPPVHEMPFDEIAPAVAAGRFDAGLLIHDAQLTHGSLGLRAVADLGEWWGRTTGGPLPLGGNLVRRDLDERFGGGSLERVAGLLAKSVRWALDHREEGIARIGPRYPGLDRGTLDRYLRMYVTPLTVSAGAAGRDAIRRLLGQGAARGWCPDPGDVRMV
jgi:1,4-dihydroxy-6-naphthoate synthase